MIFLDIFFFKNNVVEIVKKCLLCTYIYVALTVFRHSHRGCCKPLYSVDCVIPYDWCYGHKDVYTSRMRLHSPTQLAVYCVFQIHYSDVLWWIIRVKQCPLNCIPDAEKFQLTFVLLHLDTILFSDKQNYMDFLDSNLQWLSFKLNLHLLL